MLFNSLHFLLFFPVVTLVYYLLPRGRWLWLLIASCYFYMAFIPWYILVLFTVILVDYLAARAIEPAVGPRRKLLLMCSLVANIGILVYFKYFNFFAQTVSDVALGLGLPLQAAHLNVLLPIGLSFHTFQAMSYTIEVYRGRYRPERHLGIYALYVLFYPQMVAGPIERPHQLLPELKQHVVFDAAGVIEGLRLMLWGMFKKVVVADRLAVVVDQVYNHPRDFAGPSLLLATVLFAYQIYCDFSGYSDLAIGAARVMGIKLVLNFNRPYAARSVAEFWRRWHISLSTWFRDYVYIPLGGKRVATGRWVANVMVTFLISGLWHGANWTYVIWGGLNGVYLLAEETVRRKVAPQELLARWPVLNRVGQVLLTFTLIDLAWIFFRASHVGDAFYIVQHLFSNWAAGVTITLDTADWWILVAGLLVLELGQWWQSLTSMRTLVVPGPRVWRWALYYATILSIVFLGPTDARQFIYFQF